MSRKSLPIEINAEFITSAMHIVSGTPFGIATKIIPFSLQEIPLTDFNESFAEEKFKTGDYGVVIETSKERTQQIKSAEMEIAGQNRHIEAFEIIKPEILFDEGIPYLANAHILNGSVVQRQPSTSEVMERPYEFRAEDHDEQFLYMTMPAYPPQSIIRTADGRYYLSQEKPEILRERIEEALSQRLNFFISHADESGPSSDPV